MRIRVSKWSDEIEHSCHKMLGRLHFDWFVRRIDGFYEIEVVDDETALLFLLRWA